MGRRAVDEPGDVRVQRHLGHASATGKRDCVGDGQSQGDVPVKRVAVVLTAQFGTGFGWRSLFQMRAFYLGWPDAIADSVRAAVREIVAPFPTYG
jgi:hypothetical protein